MPVGSVYAVGQRVTWRHGHPKNKPFPPNHMVFDSVGTVVELLGEKWPHPPGAVRIRWALPKPHPNDLNPTWICHVDQLETALVVPWPWPNYTPEKGWKT